MQQEFLDRGVLSSLKNWLEPLPDGSLPNMNIRSALLKLLTDVNILLFTTIFESSKQDNGSVLFFCFRQVSVDFNMLFFEPTPPSCSCQLMLRWSNEESS